MSDVFKEIKATHPNLICFQHKEHSEVTFMFTKTRFGYISHKYFGHQDFYFKSKAEIVRALNKY